jgi:hypothetical protein
MSHVIRFIWLRSTNPFAHVNISSWSTINKSTSLSAGRDRFLSSSCRATLSEASFRVHLVRTSESSQVTITREQLIKCTALVYNQHARSVSIDYSILCRTDVVNGALVDSLLFRSLLPIVVERTDQTIRTLIDNYSEMNSMSTFDENEYEFLPIGQP